jgi:osmotically-inducible protein OsmY
MRVLFILAIIMIVVSWRTPEGAMACGGIDDATITNMVNAKLFEEDILKGPSISVQTYKGEVILTGAVDNTEQKKKAEDVAQSVSGVVKVYNRLEIKKK